MNQKTNPFEEPFGKFLQRVSKKVGPKAAFDLGRDAQLRAFERIIIEKGLCSKKEMERIKDDELEKMADMMEKMPPPPIPSPFSFPQKK